MVIYGGIGFGTPFTSASHLGGADAVSTATFASGTYVFGIGPDSNSYYRLVLSEDGVLGSKGAVSGPTYFNITATTVAEVGGTSFLVFALDGSEPAFSGENRFITHEIDPANGFFGDAGDIVINEDLGADVGLYAGLQEIVSVETENHTYLIGTAGGGDSIYSLSIDAAGQLSTVDVVTDADTPVHDLRDPTAIEHLEIDGKDFVFIISDYYGGFSSWAVSDTGELTAGVAPVYGTAIDVTDIQPLFVGDDDTPILITAGSFGAQTFTIGADGTFSQVFNENENDARKNLTDLEVMRSGGQTYLLGKADGQLHVMSVSDEGQLKTISSTDGVAAGGMAVVQTDAGPVIVSTDPGNNAISAGMIGAGIDVLEGTGEADTIMGLAADDDLQGMGGDDVLWGGIGDDMLAGGAGADELRGGQGKDMADFSANSAGLTVKLKAGTAEGGEATGDKLVSIEGVRGGDFDDWLKGSGADNEFWGGEGRDVLKGLAGIDSLHGGRRGDVLHGNAGDDMLYGQRGGDTLKGGNGKDDINGGHGGDRILGGVGDDFLTGGHGDDVIFGGKGADAIRAGSDQNIVTGGAGADGFIFHGEGHTLVTDFEDGVDRFTAKNGSDWVSDISDLKALGDTDAGARFAFGDTEFTFAGVQTADLSIDDLLLS